jgi:hypothetical protein
VIQNHEFETLRWPTNLDRDGIVRRLDEVREMAIAAGLGELAARFDGVADLPSADLGARVIAALTAVQEKPEYGAIATQLAMVAMNLKNLK